MRQLEGGGRVIDVRQLEGGGGESVGVDVCFQWFWLLYTLRSSFTPYPCEALYTPKVLSAKLRKNLETYNL